jgi:hypothetical protein
MAVAQGKLEIGENWKSQENFKRRFRDNTIKRVFLSVE